MRVRIEFDAESDTFIDLVSSLLESIGVDYLVTLQVFEVPTPTPTPVESR